MAFDRYPLGAGMLPCAEYAIDVMAQALTAGVDDTSARERVLNEFSGAFRQTQCVGAHVARAWLQTGVLK